MHLDMQTLSVVTVFVTALLGASAHLCRIAEPEHSCPDVVGH